MSIYLTDELEAKTKKGKLTSAKQIFLEGDKETLQQIGDKTHQLEDAIKDISVTGGASTANAVSYNNETSGMTAVTVQGAIDELVEKNKSQDIFIATKAEKSDVQTSVSELKAKNISQDAEISKKANTADVTSQMQTEQSRVNTELDKKFNKESISQESGEAEDKVMSQKSVSDKLRDLNEELNTKLPKDTNSDSSVSDGSDEFIITDYKNKVALKVDKEGTKVKILNICDENGKVVKIITNELLDKIEKNESDVSALQDTTSSLDSTKLPKDNNSDSSISDGSEEFVVTDSTNKVALKVDNEGAKVRVLNICDENGKVVKIITKELLDKIESNENSISELNIKNTFHDTEIAKKANSEDVTLKFSEESERVNGELEKKFNKENIVQDLGDSEDNVVSQKAIKTAISYVDSKISNLKDFTSSLDKIKLPKDNDSDSSISDNSEEFIITDSNNNIALKVDKDGIKARMFNICDENGKVVKTITKELLDKILENEIELNTKLPKDTDSESSISDSSYEFVIADSKNKIAFKVDSEGTKASKYNICDEKGNVVKTITKELLDKIETIESLMNNSDVGNTCLLQEHKGTYYEILKYSVSGNLKASIDTNIAKFNRSIRVECDGVESTDDTTAVSRGIFTMDFTENPIKVDETLSFWYFIPTKYWRPSQITGSTEKKSVDVIRICAYTGDEKIFEDNYAFGQYAYNVGWNLYKFLNDSFVGKTITKITFEFVSFNNNPNFQVWIGQFVADQRITPILNFNMDNDMRGISYTSGFANWLLENEFPVDLRINHLQETSNEDPGYTIVRKLYKKGLANAMPYSGSARNLNLKEAVEYLQNDKENGRLTSLYSSNSERDVVAVGNATNHIDDTLLVAERLAGYKIMRSTNAYYYTSYMDKESCIMQTTGIGIIPESEPTNVDSLITEEIKAAKKIIDNAIKYGLAINFFTHQVCSKSQKGESDYNSLGSYYEAVTEILSYAKEKERQGKIRIISMYNISKELQL